MGPATCQIEQLYTPDRSEKTYNKEAVFASPEEGIYFPEGKRYTIKEHKKWLTILPSTILP